VWSLGFVLIVVPITSMTLAAAPVERSGIASGVSNANARVASLIAVAALPLIAGISTTADPDADVLVEGFRVVLVVCAVLCAAAAALGQKALSPDRVAG
jgi:Na+/melibiose symporter-like transporter